MEATSFWVRLREAASRVDEGRLGLWAWLKEKLDLALSRPQAVEGVVERQLSGRHGPEYILKNPETKTYYRLSDRDYFLWQLMDGTRTVKDLVVAYFMEFGSFAFARVAALVGGLRANLFLTERPVYVYRQVRRELLHRQPSYRWKQILSAFFEKQFAITGLDRWLTGLYRWVGRLLYTWPLQLLYLLLSAAGLYCFYKIYQAGKYGFVTVAGSTGLGLVTLLLANLAVIVFHEMGHALTVKHFGREVRRGGFMIYMGMPAFFVDTMDIWLEGKRARLAVSWAGPYTGLILGGLASVILVTRPEFALNPVLYQFAVVAYLTVFFNLNPLLELDGYFLLMDGLEIPMLRSKSLAFIRSGLWQRARQAQAAGQSLKKALTSFSREEKIFAVFGILSAVWTAYALIMAANIWQARLLSSVRSLWTVSGDWTKILVSLAVILISSPFVLAIVMEIVKAVRGAFGWAARRGWFNNLWQVAAMLLAGVVAVTLTPSYFGYRALRPLLNGSALAIAAYLGWRGAADYAGSRFVLAFRLLGLSLFLLLLSEAGTQAVYFRLISADVASPWVIGCRHVAYASLLLASCRLLVGTRLSRLRLVEKALLAAGLVASVALLLWLIANEPLSFSSAGALLDVTGSVLPMMALALLVPTALSFWQTRFGPAWVTLAVALLCLTSMPLLGRYPLFTYALFAAILFLHHLARRRISFVTGRPEPTLALSDAHRLQRAISWAVSSVLQQTRETTGRRQAQILAEEFNEYAAAAAWPLCIVANRVEDAVPSGSSLIWRGEAYAAALTLLLDLMAHEVGEKWTTRALQQAYDTLPWEEREIGALYLFPDVRRADMLSRDFQASRQDYGGLLRRMPLFSTMDETEIGLLLSRLKTEHYQPGQAIIRQGDRGDKFYIIAQGHVEVTERDERGIPEVVNQLDRGDYFGELALLHDAPRSATCRAMVPTDVLSLSRDDFQRLVRAHFALREKVDRSIAWTDLLRRMPLFAELDTQQVQRIAAQLREATYEPGAVIIREGDIGETFYVIESGRVEVSVAQDGQERVIAERGPGEYVGEIALLLEVPRTATVKALTQTRMLTLQRGDFDRLVASHLYVSRRLERETSRRMINLRRVAEAS